MGYTIDMVLIEKPKPLTCQFFVQSVVISQNWGYPQSSDFGFKIKEV